MEEYLLIKMLYRWKFDKLISNNLIYLAFGQNNYFLAAKSDNFHFN